MANAPGVEADIAVLEGAIAAAVGGARSLGDIEQWLQSQRGVLSVDVAGHLLKSNPPQREFSVVLGGHGGRAVGRTVAVFDLGNGRFAFSEIRSRAVE